MLINCPDCDKEVSSNAETCNGCGAPISVTVQGDMKGAGVQLVTVQGTSKKLKSQLLSAWVGLVIGILILVNSSESDPDSGTLGAGLMALSVGWWFVTKCRIWWHHD